MKDKRFKEICNIKLPDYFDKFQLRMNDPFDMSIFTKEGNGIKTIKKELGSRYKLEKQSFSGCYVFIEKNKPVYVGISKDVINRLHQHVKGDSHYSSSFAYKIAQNETNEFDKSRDLNMQDIVFMNTFKKAQERIKSFKAAFIEIDDPIELYLFEVYVSMVLDTGFYNTFHTH